jgi:hypothetical protein
MEQTDPIQDAPSALLIEAEEPELTKVDPRSVTAEQKTMIRSLMATASIAASAGRLAFGQLILTLKGLTTRQYAAVTRDSYLRKTGTVDGKRVSFPALADVKVRRRWANKVSKAAIFPRHSVRSIAEYLITLDPSLAKEGVALKVSASNASRAHLHAIASAIVDSDTVSWVPLRVARVLMSTGLDGADPARHRTGSDNGNSSSSDAAEQDSSTPTTLPAPPSLVTCLESELAALQGLRTSTQEVLDYILGLHDSHPGAVLALQNCKALLVAQISAVGKDIIKEGKAARAKATRDEVVRESELEKAS